MLEEQGREMIKYAALIIDIEKSRGYGVENRTGIQNNLMEYTEILNRMFCELEEFHVTFSAGDSLQGLFVDVVSAYMYFRLLEILMHPVKLRAGIGVGAWTIKIENGMSTQQDGPAYHNARRAIEDVYHSQLSNIRIYSGEDDNLANHLINASLQLKRQQMPVQNYVQVLNELIFHFSICDTIYREFLDGIGDIITIKAEMVKMSQRPAHAGFNSTKQKFKVGSIVNNLTALVTPINLENGDLECEYVISRKTQPAVMAQILQSSRQNAASVMKSGNVFKNSRT